MNTTIAACVVLYNPPDDVLLNIKSYYEQVNYLIAIDNSEKENTIFEHECRQLFPGIIYKWQGSNTGIAGALNTACQLSIEKGYNWLLTMDQDSCFAKGDLQKMIDHIHLAQKKFANIGIITPLHIVSNEETDMTNEAFKKLNIVMTSGNLLNLAVYRQAGHFNESLFIDFVDYEYCIRLQQSGFTIIQDNAIRMKHSLGDFFVRHLLGFKFGVSNHNHIRRYYKTRNSLFVGFKYRKTQQKFFLLSLFYTLIYDPLIIVLYEENKIKKLKAIFYGIKDFLQKKYGQQNSLITSL